MKVKKWCCLLFALLFVFALAACSDSSSDDSGDTGSDTSESSDSGESNTGDTANGESSDDNADADTETSDGYKDGTYTASAMGMEGDVTVTITISDGVITDCVLDGPDETPDIGGKALEKLPDRILEAQSADIDVVSSATVTSNAVIEALTDCLQQAS